MKTRGAESGSVAGGRMMGSLQQRAWLASSASLGGLSLIALAQGPFVFDGELLAVAQVGGNAAATLLFQSITRLGDTLVLLLLTLGSMWVVGRRSRDRAWFIGAAVGGAAVIGQVLKFLVSRERPAEPGPVIEAMGHAFPSGHATATAAWLLSLYLVARGLQPGLRWAVGGIGAALAVAIGASRVCLGVHYPSDVLAGWALGVTWVALAWSWMTRRAPAGASDGAQGAAAASKIRARPSMSCSSE